MSTNLVFGLKNGGRARFEFPAFLVVIFLGVVVVVVVVVNKSLMVPITDKAKKKSFHEEILNFFRETDNLA